jgi:uridine kinase
LSVYRDVKERGRNIRGIIERYNKFVKPAFEDYIKPQRRFADIIIPHGSQNKIAINLVCTNLTKQLDIRNESLKNIKKSNYTFLSHDIFDSKSFVPEKVCLITDENLQINLKYILEDFLNETRPEYHK